MFDGPLSEIIEQLPVSDLERRDPRESCRFVAHTRWDSIPRKIQR
jgi:hypothetical protein